MYPIPKDFDVSSLTGIKLYGITFTANQIILMFDEGRIVVEGRMILRTLPASSDVQDIGLDISAQDPDIQLLSMIESNVVSVRIDEVRLNLSLTFSNGQTLVLIGDEPYECYTIEAGSRTLLV